MQKPVWRTSIYHIISVACATGYIVASIGLFFSGWSSSSIKIEARQYDECLAGSYKKYKKTWIITIAISFYLNIFGKKYFTVLFYEWNTFNILYK